jgi:hypothetical protein
MREDLALAQASDYPKLATPTRNSYVAKTTDKTIAYQFIECTQLKVAV